MANNEGVIQALHEFENMTDADKVLTQELEDLFVQIAHTGRTQIPWVYLKPVFMFKMDKVMRDFFESSPSRNSNSTEPTNNAEFDVMRQRLLDCIESFTSAPFTIQRLCELMVEPKRHYRCSEKFMRGIEKNVLVVSTMTENGEEELSNNIEGNHDNHDTTSIPNGPVTNGIITTACPTEMQSVDSRDSDGAHFPETHYPTEEELQKCQESHSIENKHLEEEEEEEETKTEDKEEEECTPNEGESTQNSSDKTNDSSESKESETDIQEHKDNKSEEKILEEKTELKEVSEEKEKCDAEKEEINENNVEEEKSSDNCDESKKESHIAEDSKETESQQESSTTSSADQDIDEPMEE